MNTGCLKIFKKSQGFDNHGKFIPPEKRGDDIQLFRGECKKTIVAFMHRPNINRLEVSLFNPTNQNLN